MEFFENHYRIRCDGLSHSVQCGVASCTKSCSYKAANRVEGEGETPNGKTYWAEEVSSDGQEVRVYGYTDEARTKLKSTLVLDRVK